ncbi:MAG: tetratricopeptide repeat protein, partial [Blastocatellia bacterium]
MTGNQFIRVTAQQRGIDIAIYILTPNKEKILTVDSHPGLQESESASAIAETPGVYFVVIRASNAGPAKGGYTLKIAELRAPSETDRHRAAAERAFAEAEELRKEPKFSQAIEKYYESIPHWRAAGDVRGEADALSIIGYAYQRLGENLKSLEVSEQALPLSRLAKDKIIEADTLNNIGLAYRWFGEWQKALNYYLEALDIFRQLKDRVRETVTLSNIGVIYRMMGEPEVALTYFFQAREIARAEKSLPREVAILNHIGVAYAVMGETDASNYEKALEHYSRVLEIAKQLGGKDRESLALHNIGSAYRNLKRYEDALNSLTQALNLRREAKLIREEPHSLYEIGLVHEAMGHKDEALDYFKQTLTLTGTAGNIPLQATTLAAMARVERDRGNLTQSRERIESAIGVIEMLRARIASLDLRTSYLSLHRKSYDFYIDLLMRQHEAEPQAGHATAAFNASERMRGRTLLDHLTDVRADLRREIEPSLLAIEQDLEKKLDAK